MIRPGLINLDFADVRAVMDEMGKAMMGTGEAEGEERAIQAAEKAIANPLLDEISLRGAKGVLINITGGHDLTLFELDEAANRIREEVDADANIIVGSTLDSAMEGAMRVSVVATGIDASDMQTDIPVPRRSLAQPLQPAAMAEENDNSEPAPVAAETRSEPSLFADIDVEKAAAEEQMEDIFEPETVRRAELVAEDTSDDLPAPAYVPRAEEPRTQMTQQAEDEAEGFVAPRARSAGTPSPEAMARLSAAIGRVPGKAQAQPQAQQPRSEDPAEKPRFGINSLINRMTGHGAENEAPAPRPARQQPPVSTQSAQPAPVESEAAEEDQIEIPAFLRRQAN
jgi:cell division protein FtsZ